MNILQFNRSARSAGAAGGSVSTQRADALVA